MPDIALVEAHDVHVFSSPSLASTTLPTDAYVLFTASLPAYYAVSASPPSNTIHLLDKSSLRLVHTLPGHRDLVAPAVAATTALHAIPKIAGITRDALLSSGKDGTVKLWDERVEPNRSAVITMTPANKSRALLCCDVSPDGLTVAAGTELSGDDALILYWDPRYPAAPLRTHSSTHSDDITALHFLPIQHHHSTSRPTILSASSDGLIATSDPTEDDEDESVQHVANWGCSVGQTGWAPPPPPQQQLHHHHSASPQVWAASDMETFSTWSNELDPQISVDIRAPSVHTQQRTWVTDYFITCPTTSAPTTDLSLFVGSNEGDVALISIPSNPNATHWKLHRLWTNGHAGVVRSVLYDEQSGVLITGGEDSKINLWPCPPLPVSVPSSSSHGHDSSESSSTQEDDSDHEMDVDYVNSPDSRKRIAMQLDQNIKRARRMSD